MTAHGNFPVNNFVVVGCGPTGLLAAAALCVAGVSSVDIYDAKDYIIRDEDDSVPLLINSRGLKFYYYHYYYIFQEPFVKSILK